MLHNPSSLSTFLFFLVRKSVIVEKPWIALNGDEPDPERVWINKQELSNFVKKSFKLDWHSWRVLSGTEFISSGPGFLTDLNRTRLCARQVFMSLFLSARIFAKQLLRSFLIFFYSSSIYKNQLLFVSLAKTLNRQNFGFEFICESLLCTCLFAYILR